MLGQNAVVLPIGDGRDAEGGAGLAFAVERLAKSAARLVWINPLLRYAGFEVRPAGIRAILSYADEFLPVHNVASLRGVPDALDPVRRRRAGRRRRRPDLFVDLRVLPHCLHFPASLPNRGAAMACTAGHEIVRAPAVFSDLVVAGIV